ncbi:MAG: hypothetical protein A3H97_04095 [Acidobacteria bacterium RIFCSPLOWO2_02_FULL_65_29]|nr:MAG: hypothetical protein A3H97_04095 [Acidobacteria bacterium RIFCSPLOWO2_02_FULL_65_29]
MLHPINSATKLPKGDLLITRDRSERPGYAISTIPGPPQILHRTYDQALVIARAWAALHAVAIWFTDDGKSFKPVGPADGSPTPPSETSVKGTQSTDA